VARTGGGDLTIVAGTTTTSGGADLYSGSTAITASARGNLSITADRTVTTGNQSAGIVATGTSVAIRANSISASGSGSGALYATGGTVSVTADNVSSTTTSITISSTGSATLAVGSVSSDGGSAISLTAGTSASVRVDRAIASAIGSSVTAGTSASFTLGVSGRLDAGTQIVLAGREGSTFVNNGTITGNDGTPTISATAGPLRFANNGAFTGLIGFTAGNDAVVNTGTYRLLYAQDFGGGADTFTNAGVLAVLPGTTAAGTVTLAGLEQFANQGLVDLHNGQAGDVLVLPGAFSGGTGSTLSVDVASGSNGVVTTDRFVVSGGATGSTRIIVNQIGAGSLQAGTVIASAGPGSSSTAFVVDPARANQGLFHYEVGFDAAAGTYSLATAPGDAVFRMLKVNEGAQQLWYRGADVWSSHVENLRHHSGGARLWGQMFGGANSRDARQSMGSFGLTRSVDLSYRQDDFGAQLGLDIVAPSEGHGWIAGVMAGYLSSRLTFRNVPSRAAYDSANIGVYAGFTGSCLFANVLAQYDHVWIAVRDMEAGISNRTTGDSVGVQGELGVRFESASFSAEPILSLAYVRTGIGHIRNIELDRMNGLRSKAGVRLSHSHRLGNGSTLTAYLHPSYVHEFKGDAGLSFATLHYANQPIGDYAEGRIGVGVANRHVASFLEGFGNWGGAYHGGGGRVGIRIGW
jgi:outer membrane autotransporter protein